ncbi:MAG TPA: PAS domain S-box protein [bacterium]|nr:PAS domain S-box protein [bacterium]
MRTGAGFYKDLEQLSRELDIIFNSTQDAMFLAQVDESEFRYLRNNSSHQKLTGFSTKDIKGKTPLELLGPDLGSIMTTNYQKCIDSKAPIIYEETITFPAGTRDWLVSISPMLEGGQVKYIVGARKDITLRKKAEAEKEELLAKFQAMFDGHQAVVLLIEPISGKIVDANPAALKFFGYPKNKILQLAIEDIHLEPADKVKQMRLMALARKQKYSLCPYRLKSGEVRMTDVYTSPIIHDGRKLLFSIIFDVTDRERYKNELYLEKETLRTTLLSIGDGIITTDKKGRITAMNKVAEDISGWTLKEVEGRPFSQIFRLINEKTGIGVENLVDRVLTEGAIVGLANHTLLLTKDGKKVPIADSAAPIKDHFDRVYGVVIVFRDVTQERKYRQRITRLSQRDFLTGLSNRRFVHQEMERLKDGSDHLPMVVVMADINGLRLVNKVFGHQEGDQVLKRAAQILKNSFRRGDLVARWGGDEFLILLPRTSAESAARIARSVEEAAANSNGLITNISIALGLAVMETADQTFDQLLQKAEEDMYRHKLLMGKSHRNAILNTMLSTLYESKRQIVPT